MKTKCLPSPLERSHECVHSIGHQYYISTLVPSPEMFLLWLLHYHHCCGNTQCWEVGGAGLINCPFFSVVTPDLNGSSVRRIMLSGTCSCLGSKGGEIPVQPSQARNNENGLLCFRHTSVKGEQELLFGALFESHILKRQEKVLQLRRKGVNLGCGPGKKKKWICYNSIFTMGWHQSVLLM